MTLLSAAALAIFISIALLLIRLLAGPSLYDRVLAVNSVGTKIVVLLALIGELTMRQDFLDIALLYALINFVTTIAILKFFRYRSFQVSLIKPDVAPKGEAE